VIDLDPTTTFFEGLRARVHEPVLGRLTGTMRFDIVEGARTTHWYVTMANGDVTTSHKHGAADTVVRADKHISDALCSGRENAMACFLRGVLRIDGDYGLAMQFQRLFPGPSPTG
jgi:hypothetical protein